VVVSWASAVVALARRRSLVARWNPPARTAVATAVGVAALFASGLVRGEVGRLLAPVLGFVLLAGVLRLEEEPGPDAPTAAAVALLLAAVDAALRVNWRL
jgi:hypothetical protein